MVGWKWASLAFLATLFFTLTATSAEATVYAPGVRAGDWAQYDLQILGDRNLFSGPFSFQTFINAQYSKVSVTTVAGTIVTLTEIVHYLNGTDYLFTTFKVDVNATEPNFLIAAGLNSPDDLASGSDCRLNSIETRIVLGLPRALN